MTPERELQELRDLTRDMHSVITDFMPNIGHCVLQNYAMLNDVLVRYQRLGRERKISSEEFLTLPWGPWSNT
jgi:hypothetical protein